MKSGDKVREKFSGREGTCRGPIFSHSVWWILVEYEKGSRAMVLEECLEVIDESGRSSET